MKKCPICYGRGLIEDQKFNLIFENLAKSLVKIFNEESNHE